MPAATGKAQRSSQRRAAPSAALALALALAPALAACAPSRGVAPAMAADAPSSALRGWPRHLAAAKDEGAMCGEAFVAFPRRDAFVVSSMLLGGLGVLCAAAGVVFVASFRHKPILRFARSTHLILISAGVACANAALVVRASGVEQPSTGKCVVGNGLLYVGLLLLMSSLTAKEHLAFLLHWHYERARPFTTGRHGLLGYVSLFMLVLLLLLVVWFVAFTPRPDPCQSFRCVSEAPAVSYVAFGYVALFAAAATVVAYKSRKVPSVATESRNITMITGSCLFSIALVGVMFMSASVPPSIETWVLAFSTFSVSTITMMLVVFSKVFWLLATREAIIERFAGTSAEAQTTLPKCDGTTRNLPSSSSAPASFDGDSAAAAAAAAAAASAAHGRGAVHPVVPPRLSELWLCAEDLSPAASPQPPPPPPPQPSPQLTKANGGEDAQARVEAVRSRCFVIERRGCWEELIDRSSGDSIWLNLETGETATTRPGVADGAEAEAESGLALA